MKAQAMTMIEISDLVTRLDGLVPRASATVLVKRDGDDARLMVGNPEGYLRLGIEIMKAVIAAGPPGVEGKCLEPDLDHVSEEWGEAFTFDLVDNPSFLMTTPTEQGRVGCGGVALGIATVFVLLKLASILFR
jgi:hypothetical protein